MSTFLYCSRAAPSAEVVSGTYNYWFRPYSKRRRYCQLPLSGTRMQRFLPFKLLYMHCLLSLAALRVANMRTGRTGQTGFALIALMDPLQMNCMLSWSALLHSP